MANLLHVGRGSGRRGCGGGDGKGGDDGGEAHGDGLGVDGGVWERFCGFDYEKLEW